ncbi:MAG: DUF433 domain-containing protein [Planctomycetes bacterium]|nr:DUF433 domain-containing protein [Planctomycetota bacterium]
MPSGSQNLPAPDCVGPVLRSWWAVVGLLASGHSNADILEAYPYLEEEDIREALAYSAWRVEEVELPIDP